MENKTGFFEESPGNKSITRVMFATIILTALFIAIYQVITAAHFDVVAFTTMCGTGCGLKLGQKAMENKPANGTA